MLLSQLPPVLLTEKIFDKKAVSWNCFEQRSSEQSTTSECGIASLHQGKTWAEIWERERTETKA